MNVGVRATQAILKMDKCTYQYAGKDVPTVYDITLQASLNSRVAVIGPNGAGFPLPLPPPPSDSHPLLPCDLPFYILK